MMQCGVETQEGSHAGWHGTVRLLQYFLPGVMALVEGYAILSSLRSICETAVTRAVVGKCAKQKRYEACK